MTAAVTTPPPTRVRDTASPGSNCAADKHGTWHAVDRYGCCCPDAQQSKFRETKMRSVRRVGAAPPSRVDGTPTRSKMRQLAALGYPNAYLAAELEVQTQRITNLLNGEYEQVHRNTAARVGELYEALRDTPARDNPYVQATVASGEVTRAENRAAAAGYEPPPPREAPAPQPAPEPAPAAAAEPEPAEERPAEDEDEPRVYANPYRDPHRPTAETVRNLIYSGAPEREIQAAYHWMPPSQRHEVVAELADRGKSITETARMLDTATRSVERQRAIAAAARAPEQDRAAPERPAPEPTAPAEQHSAPPAPPAPAEAERDAPEPVDERDDQAAEHAPEPTDERDAPEPATTANDHAADHAADDHGADDHAADDHAADDAAAADDDADTAALIEETEQLLADAELFQLPDVSVPWESVTLAEVVDAADDDGDDDARVRCA